MCPPINYIYSTMSLGNLPFDALQRLSHARYCCIAITSAWVWDALVVSPKELQVFVGRRPALSDITYFLSRICAAISVSINAMTVVATLKNCNRLYTIVWSTVLTTCFSMLLILICANGIFFKSRVTRCFLTLLWALASISISSTPFSLTLTPLEPTRYCALTEVGRLGVVGPAFVAIFNIAVFVSISRRVICHCTVSTRQGLFNSSNTCRIFNALVETGQMYFFPLFLVKICLLIITTFTPKEPIILLQYQGLLILADNVLLNIMACRIYHSLTVAILRRNSDTSTEQSTMNFRRESWATADAKNVIPSSVFAMRDTKVHTPSFALDDVFVSSHEREMHHASIF